MNEDKPRREVGCCTHPTEGTTEGLVFQLHSETEEPEPELNPDLVHSFEKQPSAPPGAEQATAMQALGEHMRGVECRKLRLQASPGQGRNLTQATPGPCPHLQSEGSRPACW